MNTEQKIARARQRVVETLKGPLSRNEPDMTSSFFEMSKVVDSPEVLQSWVEWFRSLNIPCAIVKGKGGYTLWKKGKEVGEQMLEPSLPLWKLKRKKIVYSFGF